MGRKEENCGCNSAIKVLLARFKQCFLLLNNNFIISYLLQNIPNQNFKSQAKNKVKIKN